MRSTALVTSVHARSWSGSHLPPSIVSMKWRSTESPCGQRHVVAALDHARAAALAEQALHRDGDRERGIRLVRMQRGEQPRAAGAEDQDVGRNAGASARTFDAQRLASTSRARAAPAFATSRIEAAAVAVHCHEQRPEVADAEFPQRFRVEVVEVDVLDRLDPGRFQRRRAADDGEIDAAEVRERGQRAFAQPPLPMMMRTPYCAPSAAA